MKEGRMMGLFLAVHGLMHLGVATAPDPDGSSGIWMLDPSTSAFTTLGLGADVVIGLGSVLIGLAAMGFVISGISILIRRWEMSRSRLVVTSSLISLIVLMGFFNIYWIAAIGINLALIALFGSKITMRNTVKTAMAE